MLLDERVAVLGGGECPEFCVGIERSILSTIAIGGFHRNLCKGHLFAG